MAISTVESDLWARASSGARALAAMPLMQSGLSLVVSSVITSGLGFVFWIVAARLYTSSQVGIGSAVIATMILLTDFAQLGLRTGLVRFLPTAGAFTRQLIINAYVLSAVLAAIGAIVFVAGVNIWTPELAALRETPWLGIGFVLACVFWVVFLLEDAVLLGLRMARWVPIENGVFGLVKIALLAPMVAVSASYGVFLAWALPVFLIVLVVNLGVRHRLRLAVKARQADGVVDAHGPSMREVMSYSLADWTASASRTIVIGVLPLVVLAKLGTSESGYYFLAWTIAYSVYVLSANIGDALVAESSYDEGNVDRHTLHSGLLSMAISVPAVIVAIVLAPWILRMLGEEYVVEATGVLRLLLVGAIPNVITRTYVGRLRAERRMRAVVGYEFGLSVTVLFFGWLLIDSLGIVGVGIAWLAMLTIAALYALAAESTWWWGPKLDPAIVRRASGFFERIRALVIKLPSRRLDREVDLTLDAIYNTSPPWMRVGLTADAQAIAVSGHEGRPPLTVELGRSEWGNDMLRRRHSGVASVTAVDEAAPVLRPLVPFPIHYDDKRDQHALVESAISGERGDRLAELDGSSTAVVAAALDAISELHRPTESTFTFDSELLDSWVTKPLADLGEAARVSDEEVVGLGELLRSGLDSATFTSARLHGNYVLANTRFDANGRLIGVLNWEWSEVGPVFCDRAALALSALEATSSDDLGWLVRRLLESPKELLDHQAFEGAAVPSVDERALVLFAWLRQVTPTVRRAYTTESGRFRIARQVAPVLSDPTVRAAVLA